MNEAKNAKFRENHECCSSILSFLMNFLKNIAFFFKFLIFCEIFVCFIFFGEMFTLFFRKIYAFIREIFAFLILWKFRFYHETDWSEILQKSENLRERTKCENFSFLLEILLWTRTEPTTFKVITLLYSLLKLWV